LFLFLSASSSLAFLSGWLDESVMLGRLILMTTLTKVVTSADQFKDSFTSPHWQNLWQLFSGHSLFVLSFSVPLVLLITPASIVVFSS
jgi:hypothetical protein